MSTNRTILIDGSGPYRVDSRSDGTLIVAPDWTKYRGDEERYASVFTRMRLAEEIERYLNQGQPHESRRNGR